MTHFDVTSLHSDLVEQDAIKSGLHPGHSAVVYETLEGILEGKSQDRAFAEASENQNYYGDSKEQVEDREKIARHLKSRYGVKIARDVVTNISQALWYARMNRNYYGDSCSPTDET